MALVIARSGGAEKVGYMSARSSTNRCANWPAGTSSSQSSYPPGIDDPAPFKCVSLKFLRLRSHTVRSQSLSLYTDITFMRSAAAASWGLAKYKRPASSINFANLAPSDLVAPKRAKGKSLSSVPVTRRRGSIYVAPSSTGSQGTGSNPAISVFKNFARLATKGELCIPGGGAAIPPRSVEATCRPYSKVESSMAAPRLPILCGARIVIRQSSNRPCSTSCCAGHRGRSRNRQDKGAARTRLKCRWDIRQTCRFTINSTDRDVSQRRLRRADFGGRPVVHRKGGAIGQTTSDGA